MDGFKQYVRTNISEMRPVHKNELPQDGIDNTISISQADLEAGSPKIGDMIARNPTNHNDQWLVAKKYFTENFTSTLEDDVIPVVDNHLGRNV